MAGCINAKVQISQKQRVDIKLKQKAYKFKNSLIFVKTIIILTKFDTIIFYNRN